MAANDMTGFHYLGEDSATTSYYLQCAAYKFIWAHDFKSQSTKAIALIYNSKKARKAFDECTSIMKLNRESVAHPLFLLVSGAVQPVGFMDSLLRGQYRECETTEAATGFRPWPVSLGTRQNVLELSEMSRRMGVLLIKVEMILRRVKQWKLAMDAFKQFQGEQPVGGLVGLGQQISDKQAASSSAAIRIIQSNFMVMEIDFSYVRARAENQRTAVSVNCEHFSTYTLTSKQILQMMAREEALVSIQISSSTSRDSTSMKVIAVMTMVFLPGTFFAAAIRSGLLGTLNFLTYYTTRHLGNNSDIDMTDGAISIDYVCTRVMSRLLSIALRT
ncbi:hypothetical protein AUP68_09189 [Ilyonectria robusta]